MLINVYIYIYIYTDERYYIYGIVSGKLLQLELQTAILLYLSTGLFYRIGSSLTEDRFELYTSNCAGYQQPLKQQYK